MKELFQEIIVKDWKGVNFHYKKYQKLNKIVVCHAAQYCRKCWLHRNECLCDENVQRKRLKAWKENAERQVEESEPLAVKTHMRKRKIDVERSSADQIKRLTCGVKEMITKVEKTPGNNVRNFSRKNNL